MKIATLLLLLVTTTNERLSNSSLIEVKIEISCGFAAQTSKEIEDFKRICDSDDMPTIMNKLYNGSKLEKVLAAIILNHHHSAGSLHLGDKPRKAIIEISSFSERFSICFTCTFQQEGTIKQLFNRKSFSQSYKIIEHYLTEKPNRR